MFMKFFSICHFNQVHVYNRHDVPWMQLTREIKCFWKCNCIVNAAQDLFKSLFIQEQKRYQGENIHSYYCLTKSD